MSDATVNLVRCANNGGCGACACPCHADVPNPGPHIPSCRFADTNYVPTDFADAVDRATQNAIDCAFEPVADIGYDADVEARPK